VLWIVGIRQKAYRLATVFAVCSVCHTPAAQAVTRVRTFFSLFFIPLIPLMSRYRRTCTMCGQSVSVSAADASQLVAAAQAQARGHRGTSPLPASPPAGSTQPADGGLPPA
jgi:hypothetical protein